jgi:RsiW-degrading membrane proteinase PrsW (M82 family)
MRTAIVFWTFEAVLLTVVVCIGVWLYRRFRRQPVKPLNLVIWILVAGAIVVLLNLRGH